MEPFFLHLIRAFVISALGTVAVFLLLRYYLKKRPPQVQPKAAGEETKIILPLRLQAYERIILFLERISPGSLVMRLAKPDMTARQLQAELIRTIWEEYDYNLSQQIYVSEKGWELVKTAKEDIIRGINVSAGSLPEDASAAGLSHAIFDNLMAQQNAPLDLAISELKSEVRKLF
jgi:hypothetical protein